MLKKLRDVLFMAVCFAAVCGLTASCQMFEDKYANNYLTLYDLERHFSANGIKIESAQPVISRVCRADRGMSLKISGKEIGIYKYDIDKKVQLEKLDNITKNGYIYIMAIKYPVMVNGTFMMLGYHKNPDKVKIVEAFKSFSPKKE